MPLVPSRALPLLLSGLVAAGLLMAGAEARAAGCTVRLKADGNTAAIQHAMDRRGGTPVVCLEPGVYKGARLIASRNVVLRRLGKDRAVLDAGGQGRVLTVQQDGITVRLEGLTLTEGKADKGGAVALLQKSRLVLQDCWLTGNQATLHGGGAIYADAGELELVRTRVTHNQAEHASALDLAGNVAARLVATLITDNTARATGSTPLRLSRDARLELRHSTVAYNGGHGVFLQPSGPGLSRLHVESSIVMGSPDAISVHRAAAERVAVFRSALYGHIGFVALDLASVRGLPGFNLVEAERYRPKAGAAAIGIGRCKGADGKRDLVGKPRPARCTAGALEALPADTRTTLQARAEAARNRKPQEPW